MERTQRFRMTPARREALWAYGLISPWIIGFLIFTVAPMVTSFAMAFMEYNVIQPARWIGGANYRNLTIDPLFWQSVKVTFTFAGMSLIPSLAAGLVLAMLLNAEIPGLSVWRTLYYLPSIIQGVPVAILWGFVFNKRFGVLNWALALFGIKGPGWLASPQWALPALAIMSLWGVGGGMILYLAGLQGVPTTLYDAAKVDGANGWHRFWKVTLPMISPVIFYNLVMGTIGTFQYFTNAYVMTDGGPDYATWFYNLYLYRNAFYYSKMGYASALAWVLFLFVLLLTLLIFKSSAAWVYYEGQLKGGRG
ncbi:MAG: sugar ABC transporter permease [Chloroflexi bacterium]|jgi:multiple sugar transport system permease protein|nr:sugar ABC transporter permease [Chloroflexota bacterium]